MRRISLIPFYQLHIIIIVGVVFVSGKAERINRRILENSSNVDPILSVIVILSLLIM